MNCFRNQEFIKITEEGLLKILPLGKGKSVQLVNPTDEYPDGHIAIGHFSFLKEKEGFYCYHDLQHYNRKTLKKEFKIRRTARYFIDKNGICHIEYRVGNAQRSGDVTSISDNSMESIISGSIFTSSKHYVSKKVVYKRLNEKTCQKTVTDLTTDKLVYYVKYFYE